MKKKKRWIVCGLIIFGLIIFLKFGSHFSHKTTISDAPSTISTNGWKTYSNSEFGYSLLYPPSWGETDKLTGDMLLFSNPAYLKERLSNPQNFSKENYASVDVQTYKYGTRTAAGLVTKDTNLGTFAQSMYGDLIVPAKATMVGGKVGLLFDRKRMVLKPEFKEGMQNCPPADNTCYIQNGTTKQVWLKTDEGLIMIEDNYGRGYTSIMQLDNVFQALVKSIKLEN